MGLSQRSGALLLVFMAAVCMEFYQAQHVVGIRCKCPSFSKIQRSNLTDFQVTGVRAGCDQVELTVTRIKLDNSTETLCINPKRKLGLQIISCWERINKDKSRKMECLDKQRRLEDRASED